MVVGVKEASDRKFKNTATLKVASERYKNRRVYGDTEAPKRRTVFAPDSNRDSPDDARVYWQGRWYDAQLSFRYGSQGQAIPVYEFFVE